jgi:hypothetical protein
VRGLLWETAKLLQRHPRHEKQRVPGRNLEAGKLCLRHYCRQRLDVAGRVATLQRVCDALAWAMYPHFCPDFNSVSFNPRVLTQKTWICRDWKSLMSEIEGI